MVKKREKQLDVISKNLNINLHKIIKEVLIGNYTKYDVVKLSWYKDTYRLRVWKIRIIFKDNIKVKILKIDNRWDIYKWL